MFTGEHDRLLDEKGRIVLPSNFRRHLKDAASIAKSLQAPCLMVYSANEIGKVAERLIEQVQTKKVTADIFAQQVLNLEQKEYIRYGVLDSSTWARRGDVGPSIAETMINSGCRWRPSDRSPRSRINGKLEIHKRLSVRDKGDETKPSLFIFWHAEFEKLSCVLFVLLAASARGRTLKHMRIYRPGHRIQHVRLFARSRKPFAYC